MGSTGTRTSRLAWGTLGGVCAALVVLAHAQLGREADRAAEGRTSRAVVAAGAIAGVLADRDPGALPDATTRAIGSAAAGIVAADGRIEAVRVWSADELVAATDEVETVAPATDVDRVVTEEVAGGRTRTIVPLARSGGSVAGVVEVVEADAPAAHPWGALRAAFAVLLVIALIGFSATFVRRPPVPAAQADAQPRREPARRAPDAARAADDEDEPPEDDAAEVASLRAAVERARAAERAAHEQLRSAEIELEMLREERRTGPAVRIRELQEALRESQTEAALLAERLRWLSIEEDDDPKIAELREAMRRSEAEAAVRRAGLPPSEQSGGASTARARGGDQSGSASTA